MVGDIGNPLYAILLIVIFFAIVLGAFFTLGMGGYLYHRQNTSRRRAREQEFDEVLVKRAVSAGQMAAEEVTQQNRRLTRLASLSSGIAAKTKSVRKCDKTTHCNLRQGKCS
jgi:hypothetical protein